MFRKNILIGLVLLSVVVGCPLFVMAVEVSSSSTTTASTTDSLRSEMRQLTELLAQLRARILQLARNMNSSANRGSSNDRNKNDLGTQNAIQSLLSNLLKGQNQPSSQQPAQPLANLWGDQSPANYQSPAAPLKVDYVGAGISGTSSEKYTGDTQGKVYCGGPNGAVKPGKYTFKRMTRFTRAEGETVGTKDNKLSSIEEYVAGKVKCVSVATGPDMQVGGIPFGTLMRCPKLEQMYNGGKPILLARVDIGSTKYFSGTSRLDLYTEDYRFVKDDLYDLECEVLPLEQQVSPK